MRTYEIKSIIIDNDKVGHQCRDSQNERYCVAIVGSFNGARGETKLWPVRPDRLPYFLRTRNKYAKGPAGTGNDNWRAVGVGQEGKHVSDPPCAAAAKTVKVTLSPTFGYFLFPLRGNGKAKSIMGVSV